MCMCLTRGPLPLFKLIGNLKFKKIKIPRKKQHVTSLTDGPSTVCPPCNCADCFTTEPIQTKQKIGC
ncbi:hypothetical protein SFRURICE_019170 [Spodoptera frugiperda]|nr:hypothetical protein SFRURICE_019170 [Spodoptera frugiperda]